MFVCANCFCQVKHNSIVGRYEGNHLMLHKVLVLRTDSTYLYSIEGDMYPTPIKQEGYWKAKNHRIKLNATHDYKALTGYYADSIKANEIYFYLFTSQGNPVINFIGSVNFDSKKHTLTNIKENLYKVVFESLPATTITIRNQNHLYNDFKLELGNQKKNIFHINLFIYNELQKDKWKFKYRDGEIYQKRGFKYTKVKSD